MRQASGVLALFGVYRCLSSWNQSPGGKTVPAQRDGTLTTSRSTIGSAAQILEGERASTIWGSATGGMSVT
ncbi:hypothetical protein BDY21DRAFT_343432 [Lineolata rhizophorae]|uniref:Secreted protein n=1 Tax=Lineolata rhizophorae TaxID=578093 RepID=A0A6A6P2C6_9PEZI|nr:hypothetical protein BDY21DRAFT_343432 [Lineolata rhizophorae]